MINSVNISTLYKKRFLSYLFPNGDLNLSFPANLVLEDTVERIYHENAFAENFHGLFLIRGENVVLLGEIVRPNLHTRLEQNLKCYFTGSR